MKQKEIYTDLEKPGIDSTTFYLKLDSHWLNEHIEKSKDFHDLIIGVDLDFVGSPTTEGENIVYKMKAISDKAKKLFIAE